MNQIKIENLEGKDDEEITGYESYYNAFVACYWIIMIIIIHFLFRFLNARDNIDNNADIRFVRLRAINIVRQVRPGENFHRRFIENLEDDDLGNDEEFEDEFDSRGI